MADKKTEEGGASTGWPTWLAENMLAPLIIGIVVATILLFYGPKVAENVALQNPTCEDPQGAIPLPRERIVEIEASQTADPTEAEGHVGWADPENVADGDSATYWVPQDNDLSTTPTTTTTTTTPGRPTTTTTEPPTTTTTVSGANAPYVKFAFADSVDLALVCIVNGYQYSEIRDATADRLRTVEVSTNEPRDPEVTYLQAVGGTEAQNPQTLRIDQGDTEQVKISIIDVYHGQEVFDPEEGRVGPTGRTTIAEVYLFSRDPDVRSPWLFWVP